ncbi:3-phosphoglycerate kinase [Pseudomonas sp. UL073]|uniref:3-phosphoglycerate kinase n=1 Tax=Zestomonas insulae TaxID=2809017 RepID=A0ABS2ID97_9GAMM|nr:3-phosphoglycerate kinase [Pseudomonas insulae]MBM7060628.1 3-phosphoglycerate kinase [Pseudomonas insulae]
MNKLCCVLFAALPLTALAATYPVEVEKQMNGAEVSASGQAIDYNLGGLNLYNYGGTSAACTVVFRNGPEAPRTRRATLKPGENAALTSKFNNSILRLRIKVTCEPQE